MTETISDRLRAAALLDAHFAVPAEHDELVLLLHDAAEELDAIRQRAEVALVAGPQPSARAAVDAWMDVFVARSQYFEDTLTKANDKIRGLKRDCLDAGLMLQETRRDSEALRRMLVEARRLVDAGLAERRAFLELAVCHPGPPASEHEDYDPEAPLGELEAAVLERLDHETTAARDLWDIRELCEQALGRTPDPARKTMQVVRDLLAWTRAMGLLPPSNPDEIGSIDTAGGRRTFMHHPIVRPEHFAGPFPAISGYVKRTAEARAATIDQALRMLKDGQRLAVHDEPERVDILLLDPGQEPPLGQTWTVYEPMTPELREQADQRAWPDSFWGTNLATQDAVAKHIQAHGGDPERATVAQNADAMTATSSSFTYAPNAAGDGLLATPVGRAGAGGTIRIVGGDPEAIAALGLEQPASPVERDTDLVMPLDIIVTVPADSVALPNIGGPAQASIMWARLPIWDGPATLDLRFENNLHDVTELGDRTTRYEQDTRGIGTIWLALDPKTAARVLEYVGRGVDYPVMLCVVWAGHPVQFWASLARLADGECAPEAQHIGAGREWYGYTIAVGKYPDLAARLFHKRNQASAKSRED